MKFQETVKETKYAKQNSIGTKHCNTCVSEYRAQSKEKPKQEKHETGEERSSVSSIAKEGKARKARNSTKKTSIKTTRTRRNEMKDQTTIMTTICSPIPSRDQGIKL
eukprot:12420583-Karenia_brevis.AAC.1